MTSTDPHPFPKGFYGKSFEDMTQEQLINCLRTMWTERENYRTKLVKCQKREMKKGEF